MKQFHYFVLSQNRCDCKKMCENLLQTLDWEGDSRLVCLIIFHLQNVEHDELKKISNFKPFAVDSDGRCFTQQLLQMTLIVLKQLFYLI